MDTELLNEIKSTAVMFAPLILLYVLGAVGRQKIFGRQGESTWKAWIPFFWRVGYGNIGNKKALGIIWSIVSVLYLPAMVFVVYIVIMLLLYLLALIVYPLFAILTFGLISWDGDMQTFIHTSDAIKLVLSLVIVAIENVLGLIVFSSVLKKEGKSTSYLLLFFFFRNITQAVLGLKREPESGPDADSVVSGTASPGEDEKEI